MIHRVLVIILFLLVCKSCCVGPRYAPPAVEIPVEWKGVETPTNVPPAPSTAHWWTIFNDSKLDELEMLAICNNPDLFTAMARIAEAWEAAGVKRADLFPTVDTTPNFNKTNQLFKIYLPNNFNFPILSQDLGNPFRIHEYNYSLPFNLRYEFDLWGKFRNQYKSAFRSAEAQEEAYQTALLSLTSDVAGTYFHARTLDSTIDILRKTVAARNKTLELARSRFEAGLISYDNLASAELEKCNTESDLEEAIRQRGVQENVLATLLGVPASEFQLASAPLADHLPTIPAGIPSSILRRRPDIAQAERNMAAQHAQIGVAYADLFPAVSLTTTLGFFSPTAADFLTWQSRFLSITVGAVQALFDAGRRRREIRRQWARFAQAAGSYQQQVIGAFAEVENALVSLEFQAKQVESLLCARESAKRLTALSFNRYRIGSANYIEVVTNERSELEAQRAYVAVEGQRYQSTILLIKALGGSWNDYRLPPAVTPDVDEKTSPPQPVLCMQ